MRKLKIYYCDKCGRVEAVYDGDIPYCCGAQMTELASNKTEASTEKHIPVVSVRCGKATVKVGSVAHPMTAEHYIKAIFVETENGYFAKELQPSDEPEAKFAVGKDKILSVSSFCNLHGLWENELG